MTHLLLRAAAIGCVLFGLAPAANAGSLTYDSYSVLNNQNVVLNDPALNIDNELGGSGQVSLYMTAGSTLLTWCVDIADDLRDAGSFTGASIKRGGIWDGISALISNGSTLLGTDTDASSALQLAIWQTEYGSSLHLDAAQPVLDKARLYEANIANGTWTADTTQALIVLNGDGANQSQAYLVSVPEPASGLLFCAACAGTAFLVRRRRTPAAHPGVN